MVAPQLAPLWVNGVKGHITGPSLQGLSGDGLILNRVIKDDRHPKAGTAKPNSFSESHMLPCDKLVVDHCQHDSTPILHELTASASRARNVLWITRNGKREGGTRPVIRLHPEPAMMSLDDRAAHGQPNAHTPALG